MATAIKYTYNSGTKKWSNTTGKKDSSGSTTASSSSPTGGKNSWSVSTPGGSAASMSAQQVRSYLSGSQRPQPVAPIPSYMYPYESLMRDITSKLPQPYTTGNIDELSKQYARLQVDPARQEIQRRLAGYDVDAESQRRSTESAYAGVPAQTQRMLDEARRYALESSVARGAGRSGVVNWETEKRTTPVIQRGVELEGEKAAKLADIASRLALAKQQGQGQLTDLATREGELTSQQAQALRALDYANSTGNWQQAFSAAQSLANMAQQAQQFEKQYAASLAPSLAPSTYSSDVGKVGLRDYASKLGMNVGYDAASDTVSVGNKYYSAPDLERLGGVLVNDRWVIPESVAKQLWG